MLQRIAPAAMGIIILFTVACQGRPAKEAPNELNRVADDYKRKTAASGTVEQLAIDRRKFVQSGAMEFETPDTKATTEKIEATATGMGGHILQSHIKMNEQKTVTSPVSTDSVKKLLYYQLQNEMIVRVPDTSLRRFMAGVEALSSFTFSRNIDAEDVSVQWLSGGMKYNRLDNQVQRREDKPVSTTLEEKEESRDAALAAQVQLADHIGFSTVQLNFHQPLQLSVQYLVNDEAQWAKGPGFFKRAGYAFAGGWAKCKEVLLLLISAWWLLAVFFLLWLAYRKWGSVFAGSSVRGNK